MESWKQLFDQQRRLIVAVAALLLAVVVPAMVVSAAQLTERSIALSSSSASADGVSYEVNFTADGAAAAFVVDFCTNTPLIGESCTAPGAGFDLSSAASASTGVTNVAVHGSQSNTLVIDKSITSSENVSIDVTDINNPDAAGTVYARIVTYSDAVSADSYASDNLGSNSVDSGSVAVSITDSIGVSGAVLETMTFCVAGDSGTVNTNDGISANCGDAAGNAPTLELGETSGGVVALDATAVSEGSIYAQISTNAVSGAIVRLKSNAAGCGGLLRAGAPAACDVIPTTDDIAAGQAEFGLKLATASDPSGVTPSGTFQAANASGYNASTFLLNYNGTDESTGVTSVYGDPVLDTNDAPANNKNMEIVFGASISNDTPAGLYSADMNMIATGKF